MDILLKAAAIAITASVLGLVIRKHTPDLEIMLTLAAGAAIFIGAAALIAPLIRFMDELAETAGLSSAIVAPVYKALGIAIVGKIVSDVCKDAGQAVLASSVELCAALSALICAAPLMRTVLHMLRELI
ncbi:MAG: stage III sporulation AC/AD family protein [Oscillospiraceae bacterium]|jgi:stage III sporulation protein AD|nr:stage III sporulation AC/AD family protein [Oscillospiraceae bacterium]